jgi:hypothetical protein
VIKSTELGKKQKGIVISFLPYYISLYNKDNIDQKLKALEKTLNKKLI